MAKNKKFVIGVDLGGTSIKVGVVSKEGKLIKKGFVDTLAHQGPKVVVSQIKKGIRLVLGDYEKEIGGIGIGAPGVVSMENGTVENPPNLPGWKKVYLSKVIEDEFCLKTVVENDANSAAVGEMVFGAGKNFTDFIMVTLGTGVGGGIIVNRKLYHGMQGAAGELGHTTIDFNGNKCNCGSYGCVETYVGNGYLVERVHKQLEGGQTTKINDLLDNNLNNLTPKIINDAALLGDEFAKSVIAETGKYLAYALASSINLLDIHNVIIGGGVAGFGAPLFESVRKTVKERVLSPLAPKVKVVPAKLKNEAGIKGASSLVFYSEK
ncbi:MAG: ROK family protein [Ignavibacteria bacterium]|jgi:glucokinase|nr:ROK family protein [Ignavibacteria bacterium]MCU7502427.1 ROK family protein [Ignavibacteria bacterium]MCU7515008.1 ROK family protein [Ignavibacteria bacterium]